MAYIVAERTQVFICENGGEYTLRELSVEVIGYRTETDTTYPDTSCIRAANYSVIYLRRVSLKFTFKATEADQTNNYQYVGFLMRASDNAAIYLLIHNNADIGVTTWSTDIPESETNLNVYAMYVDRYGAVYLGRTQSEQPDPNATIIQCSGKYNHFASVRNVGSIFTYGTGSYQITFTDNGVTGQRYYLNNGSHCDTNGGGSEYFPGTTEGTLDATTYCWYQ